MPQYKQTGSGIDSNSKAKRDDWANRYSLVQKRIHSFLKCVWLTATVVRLSLGWKWNCPGSIVTTNVHVTKQAPGDQVVEDLRLLLAEFIGYTRINTSTVKLLLYWLTWLLLMVREREREREGASRVTSVHLTPFQGKRLRRNSRKHLCNSCYAVVSTNNKSFILTFSSSKQSRGHS